MPKQPKSKLERELDEILTKKSREPIPFASHPRVTNGKNRSSLNGFQVQAMNLWHQLVAIPLLLAFALVFMARLVNGFSPLLALILSAAAVVAIWLPGIMRLARPQTASTPDVKYWRGRPYSSAIKDAVSRHPIDSIKRYFDRHR